MSEEVIDAWVLKTAFAVPDYTRDSTHVWTDELDARIAYSEAIEDVQSGDLTAAVLCQRIEERGAEVLKPIAGAWDEDAPDLAGETADLIARINDNDANAERSYWYVWRADGKVGELVGPWETFHGEADLWMCIDLMFPKSYDYLEPDMIQAEPARMRFDERFIAGRDDAELRDWIIEGKAKEEEE